MARRRRRKKYYSERPRKPAKRWLGVFKEGETPPEDAVIKLKSDTLREIIAVLLLVFASISFLSLFGIAGRLGEVLNDFLRLIFGIVAFIIPLILIAIGVLLFYPDKFRFKLSNSLGVILGIVTVCGFIHLFVLSHSLNAARDGVGGGYLGYSLNLILGNLIGFWASLIILIGLFIVAVLLTFDTSLEKIKEIFSSQKIIAPTKVKLGGLRVNKPEHLNETKEEKEKEKSEESPDKFEPLFIEESNGYELPSLELLSYSTSKVDSGDIKKNAQIIKDLSLIHI